MFLSLREKIFYGFIIGWILFAIIFWFGLTPKNPNFNEDCYNITPSYDVEGLDNLIQQHQEHKFTPQEDPWMKISQNGLSVLLKLEGYAPKAYWDHKQWSVGYGQKAHQGASVRQIDALIFVTKNIEPFERVVNESVTVPLNQNQFDALVMLSYNIGPSAFKNSTLLRKINAGDPDADKHFLDWRYAGGKPILLSRRGLERSIYRLDK